MEVPISPTILDDLWWPVPGCLAGVRQPTPQELPDLRRAGIGAIVSVLHVPTNLDHYVAAGLPHGWLPILPDHPPRLEQVAEFTTFVGDQLRQGHAVAVHCSGGRHRTGTMVAAYLIGQGATYSDAMAQLLAAQPTLELPEAQKAFLVQLPRLRNLITP